MDLGIMGIGVLLAMSLAFGLIAQFVAGHATSRWLWLPAAIGYFVGGLFISEVWFGWATAAELQPNIDGLSFDEVLLLALIPGVVPVLIARWLGRRSGRSSSRPAMRLRIGPRAER